MQKLLSAMIAVVMLFVGSTAAYADDYTFSRNKTVHDALLLVGNVRYVWGGGHQGTNEIQGVNPIWRQFNKLYTSSGVNVGVGVDNHYCALHPQETSDLQFVDSAEDAQSVARQRCSRLNIDPAELVSVISSVDFESPIATHRFDGLDCTGFCKWLIYQQAPELSKEISGTIANTSFVYPLSSFSEMKAGDFISWREHMVMILGEVTPGCYLHIESTPGVLRLGITCTSQGVSPEPGKQLINEYYSYCNMDIQDTLNVYYLDEIATRTYGADSDGFVMDASLEALRLRNLNEDLQQTDIRSLLGLPSSSLIGLC